MNAKLITALALIALAMLFVIQNLSVVELRFLFWTLSMSRALLFILLLVIGAALGWLLHGHATRVASKDK